MSQDLAIANVEISLWYLLKCESASFNLHGFYAKLLVSGSNESNSIFNDVELASKTENGGWEGFDQNSQSIRQRRYKKRALGSTLFDLGKIICIHNIFYL